MSKESIEFLQELVKRVKASDQVSLLKLIQYEKFLNFALSRNNDPFTVKVEIKYEQGYGYRSICSMCGNEVDDNYCQCCGAKLDWQEKPLESFGKK